MFKKLAKKLINQFSDVRYIAIYDNNELFTFEKEGLVNNSSHETDKYEELLVNPTLLKLTTQRGNIDCGGLDFLIVSYGNFYQLVKSTKNGHISICIDKKADLNNLPKKIFQYFSM